MCFALWRCFLRRSSVAHLRFRRASICRFAYRCPFLPYSFKPRAFLRLVFLIFFGVVSPPSHIAMTSARISRHVANFSDSPVWRRVDFISLSASMRILAHLPNLLTNCSHMLSFSITLRNGTSPIDAPIFPVLDIPQF